MRTILTIIAPLNDLRLVSLNYCTMLLIFPPEPFNNDGTSIATDNFLFVNHMASSLHFLNDLSKSVCLMSLTTFLFRVLF